MEYDIRQYIDSLSHDPFWVQRITNYINKLLVNREYIDFFIQIYMQWSSDNSIECLPHFDKMALSQFKVYIEVEKMINVMCAITVKLVFTFNILMLKKGFFYFTDVKNPYWFEKVE